MDKNGSAILIGANCTSLGLSAAQAAQIGTAGYTAMLCVDAVVRNQCIVYYCQ